MLRFGHAVGRNKRSALRRFNSNTLAEAATMDAAKIGRLRDDDEAAIALEGFISGQQMQGLAHSLGKQ
jgi:hypothetical protein